MTVNVVSRQICVGHRRPYQIDEWLLSWPRKHSLHSRGDGGRENIVGKDFYFWSVVALDLHGRFSRVGQHADNCAAIVISLLPLKRLIEEGSREVTRLFGKKVGGRR